MQKIIFKFTMVVASALASHTTEAKWPAPVSPKPEIKVERARAADTLQPVKEACNKKTAWS